MPLIIAAKLSILDSYGAPNYTSETRDTQVILLILNFNFNKEWKSSSQISDKENHKSESNPSKTIILNDTDFENEILQWCRA